MFLSSSELAMFVLGHSFISNEPENSWISLKSTIIAFLWEDRQTFSNAVIWKFHDFQNIFCCLDLNLIWIRLMLEEFILFNCSSPFQKSAPFLDEILQLPFQCIFKFLIPPPPFKKWGMKLYMWYKLSAILNLILSQPFLGYHNFHPISLYCNSHHSFYPPGCRVGWEFLKIFR